MSKRKTPEVKTSEVEILETRSLTRETVLHIYSNEIIKISGTNAASFSALVCSALKLEGYTIKNIFAIGSNVVIIDFE